MVMVVLNSFICLLLIVSLISFSVTSVMKKQEQLSFQQEKQRGSQTLTANKILITADTTDTWVIVKGTVYPYSFSVPEKLRLISFPNDPYDIRAITMNNVDPHANVLIGVDNLEKSSRFKPFLHEPKIKYIKEWGKQFFGITGIHSLEEFTSKEGLKGYIVIFETTSGASTTKDVFLEIPHQSEVMIHLAQGSLTEELFMKIVHSVIWKL